MEMAKQRALRRLNEICGTTFNALDQFDWSTLRPELSRMRQVVDEYIRECYEISLFHTPP